MNRYEDRTNPGNLSAKQSRLQVERGAPQAMTSQQYVPSSNVQARKQLFNRLQRAASPTLPGKQYTSNSPNNDYEDKVLHQERDDNNKLLSAPYDMTKVNSGFTSITQKTQKASNMSTTAPSYTMRTEMANKYIKQQKQRKEGLTTTAIQAHVQTRNQQQQQQKPPPPPPHTWQKPVTAKRIG